jgi:hypothetical protein
MEFYSGQPENPAASVRDYCTGVLNCKTNDFRAGFKVAEWRMFFHSAWSQISPAHFKQV